MQVMFCSGGISCGFHAMETNAFKSFYIINKPCSHAEDEYFMLRVVIIDVCFNF